MAQERQALEVLLVNLGTPDEPTADGVRRFLDEFLSDPLVVDWPRFLWLPILRGIVLRKRPERVAELYRSIWSPSGSPLRVQTEDLARRLAEELGDDATVRAVYRYGTPSLEEELHASASRAKRVVAVPLFPQRTASSSGSVQVELARAARALSIDGRVECRELAPDDSHYVEALRDRVRESFAALDTPPEHLLVSFHGIPARVDRKEGAGYSADCAATAAALLDALDWDPARATLSFQSRFGPERWLGPATADLLLELPKRGVRRLGVVAPGFLTDGLETLEELGVQGRESFLEAGGTEFTLVPAVADHQALAAGLQRLVKSGGA
ncbi:MAG: ferrochelatase [Planctomycetes bacterium]|nr:ferrochelatase [Planctomycetota bacterium]